VVNKTRPQVCAEIAPGRDQRGGKEQRRQEKKKNQFGIEPHGGQSGNQAQQQPADDEQNRIRNVQPAGDQRQHRHREQQPDKNFHHAVHARRAYARNAFAAMIRCLARLLYSFGGGQTIF
jgi:hypothetical protein